MDRIRKEVQGYNLVEPLFFDPANSELRKFITKQSTNEDGITSDDMLRIMALAIAACTGENADNAGLILQRTGIVNSEVGREAVALCGWEFFTNAEEEDDDDTPLEQE